MDNQGSGAAEDALRWHFGTGSSTAAGDMGLRSSLGAMLENAHEQQLVNGHVARRSPAEVRAYDPDAIERNMARLIHHAARDRQIIASLRELEPWEVDLLKVHFADKPFRPGVSAAVKLTREARVEARRQYGDGVTTAQVDQCILEAAWPKEGWLKRAVVGAQARVDKAVARFAEVYRVNQDADWRKRSASLMRWEKLYVVN